jgi:hypothetical protein
LTPLVLQQALGRRDDGGENLHEPHRRAWKRLRELCREWAVNGPLPLGDSLPPSKSEALTSGEQPVDSRFPSSTQDPAAIRPLHQPVQDSPHAEARADLKTRRHHLADPIFEKRQYQNCDDWAAEKQPKQNQAAPSARALDNWLSGRTIRPIWRVRKWIAGSLGIKPKEVL